jgi:hypothetical protein
MEFITLLTHLLVRVVGFNAVEANAASLVLQRDVADLMWG